MKSVLICIVLKSQTHIGPKETQSNLYTAIKKKKRHKFDNKLTINC